MQQNMEYRVYTSRRASADGTSQVRVMRFVPSAPRAVVQVSHGMAEHIGRYEHLAGYLAKRGILVAGHDHIGHGSHCREEDLGFFGEEQGIRHMLSDLKGLGEELKAEHPGLPIALLGHSMGSFLARALVADQPRLYQGLILSGTGGPSMAARMGARLAGRMARRAPRGRSAFLAKTAFLGYNRGIEKAGPMDWLSRDAQVVRSYHDDPLCGFPFTNAGYRDLSALILSVSGTTWAKRVPADLPVLLFSGDRDPVGQYGRGVRKVARWLIHTGHHNVRLKLYPGGRHEMLNETSFGQVYEDAYAWLCETLL